MLKNRTPVLLGCLLAGACLAPLAAQADPVVSMDLTGVAGPSLAGVYTDPYYAKIGPANLTLASQFTSQNSYSAAIYCDDYYDEVSTGHIWQATVTNMGELSKGSVDASLMFQNSAQATDYMAAAWLAEQMAWSKLSTTQTELDSYAMWYIFDSNALNGLSSSDHSGAITAYDAALSAVANDDPSAFSDVNIYTPMPSTPGHAGSQEYLAVNAPEPSTLSLALFGLAAVGFAARRRRRVAADTASS